MNEGFLTLSYEEARAPDLTASVLLAYLRAEAALVKKSKAKGEEENGLPAGEGWLFMPGARIEEDMKLSQVRQSKLLAMLRVAGKIEVKKIGVPPKRYIRVTRPKKEKLKKEAEELEKAT